MSWLSSIELENLINHYSDLATKQAFIGIFSMDKLPHHLPHLPILLIVNTDSSNLPGKHWKAVYISSDKVGEVFDSCLAYWNLPTAMDEYVHKKVDFFKSYCSESLICNMRSFHFVLCIE